MASWRSYLHRYTLSVITGLCYHNVFTLLNMTSCFKCLYRLYKRHNKKLRRFKPECWIDEKLRRLRFFKWIFVVINAYSLIIAIPNETTLSLLRNHAWYCKSIRFNDTSQDSSLWIFVENFPICFILKSFIAIMFIRAMRLLRINYILYITLNVFSS